MVTVYCEGATSKVYSFASFGELQEELDLKQLEEINEKAEAELSTLIWCPVLGVEGWDGGNMKWSEIKGRCLVTISGTRFIE